MNNAVLMPPHNGFLMRESWKVLNSTMVYVCLIERGAVNDK